MRRNTIGGDHAYSHKSAPLMRHFVSVTRAFLLATLLAHEPRRDNNAPLTVTDSRFP
jgi:hypothetical protein